MRAVIVILVALLIGGGSGDGIVCYAQNAKPAKPAQPTKGPATAAAPRQPKEIVATGTIEPAKVVDVCSQETGQIVQLGVDPHDPGKSIDYGSSVEVGTVLAKIDPRVYAARVKREQAGYVLCRSRIDVGHGQSETARRPSRSAS